jgi:hypothetical protein
VYIRGSLFSPVPNATFRIFVTTRTDRQADGGGLPKANDAIASFSG